MAHADGPDGDKDKDNDYLREFARRGRQRPTPGGYFEWLARPQDPRAYEQRVACVRRYAFAVPTAAALAAVARHAPIVELGAGTGYWAFLLRRRGVDVVAYDIAPPGQTPNRYKFEPRTWTAVEQGGVDVLARHGNRTLFLCWPSYRDSFAGDALAAYRGRRLVYVGEPRGGHTADGAFFNRLDADWHLVETLAIPRWPGVNDALYVYLRWESAGRGTVG